MKSKPRFVFDTNTIVSAFLFYQSTPGRALQAAIDKGELLLSIEVAEELGEVLRRNKLDRYLRKKVREEFLKVLIQDAVFMEIPDRIRACRDPKDDKFLELAVTGQAECIVTGDDDLLILNPFRGVPILTAAEFLDRVDRDSR